MPPCHGTTIRPRAAHRHDVSQNDAAHRPQEARLNGKSHKEGHARQRDKRATHGHRTNERLLAVARLRRLSWVLRLSRVLRR